MQLDSGANGNVLRDVAAGRMRQNGADELQIPGHEGLFGVISDFASVATVRVYVDGGVKGWKSV
jgi:hypothetical protein